jgi:hypothetical protein
MFYALFIEGSSEPIVGYYQVNKVSSVNSQLTNTGRSKKNSGYDWVIIQPYQAPAEDGFMEQMGMLYLDFTRGYIHRT